MKYYVDQSIDEPTLLENLWKNLLMTHSLSNLSVMTLNSEPTSDTHVATKSHVYFLSEHDRSRRDLSTLIHD